MEFVQSLFAPYAEYTQVQIILEVLAAALGIASVIFAAKGNILVYPTGIISTAMYVFILFEFGLYGDMGINAYYFVMSIYGWYNWSKEGEEKNELPIQWDCECLYFPFPYLPFF